MDPFKGQGGIQMLLTAEQEAQHIVSNARNCKFPNQSLYSHATFLHHYLHMLNHVYDFILRMRLRLLCVYHNRKQLREDVAAIAVAMGLW